MESWRQDNMSLSRSGRPHQLSEAQRDHVYELSFQSPHTKYTDLVEEVDNTVQKRSLRYLLQEMGRRKWKQMDRPELKAQHAAQHFAWAQKYESSTPADWARVKWSDECTVERGAGIKTFWTFTRPRDQLLEEDVHVRPCGKGLNRCSGQLLGKEHVLALSLLTVIQSLNVVGTQAQ